MKAAAATNFLAPLLALSAGCVVVTEDSSSDDLNDGARTGAIRVSWDLLQGDDNQSTTCLPGAIAEIVIEPIDDGDELLDDGDEQFQSLPCVALDGFVGGLPPGAYLVWINIFDGADNFSAQSSVSEVVVTRGTEIAVTFEISLDRGGFFLTWFITDGQRELLCEEVGATDVRVVSIYLDGGGEPFDDRFPCEDGGAITPVLPLGSYEVEIGLLGIGGEVLGGPLKLAESLDFGNDIRDLGDIEFALAPQ